MSSSCSNLTTMVDVLNSSLIALQEQYDGCGCGVDPCAVDVAVYSKGLHVGGIFVLLFTSLFGVAIPLLGKYCQALRVPPFALVLGKHVGTGVVLSVALIHMLVPSNASLTSPCVPVAFNTTYTAYAFLFALLAALMMQFVDAVMERVMMGQEGVGGADAAVELRDVAAIKAVAMVDEEPLTTKKEVMADQAAFEQLNGGCDSAQHDSGPPLAAIVEQPKDQEAEDGRDAEESCTHHGSGGQSQQHLHCHSHAMLPAFSDSESILKRLLAAALMEFGVTSHSVFVGLTVGVVPDSEMKVLLIALSFHQAFEGIALGSRLAEATFRQVTEVIFSLIFALAAPVGMSIGVSLMFSTGLNVNDTTFLLLQGVFEGSCAGILLYLGFQLMFNDFVVDAATHCNTRDHKHGDLRRLAMFVAVWTGAGVMAFIGQYI